VSISKNFVIKHGLEASTDLILANADTRKVGIGTTTPQYTLHVNGGIGATDFYLTGIGTFANELNVGLGGTVLTVLGIGNSIGIGTALPAYLLDIRSPVSTGQTALYVQGDVRITGDLSLDDVTLDDAEIQNLTVTEALNVTSPGISTFGGYVDINNSVDISNNLNVVGLSTLGGYVDINNSVDVSGALNVVGLSTLGGYVDINNSVDVGVNLNVVGLSTLGGYVDINNSVDISNNLNVVGVTTLATADINAGEIDVTRIETGNLNVTGIATIASVSIVGAALSTLTVSGISTLAIVDINGGDIEVSNVDTVDLNVTGIGTLGTVRISSGIITATSGIVTYYGDGQYLDLTNNPSTGIGIGTTGGLVGYGITFIDFKGAGVSTTFYNSSVGIATIFFEGGGGGSGTIGIGTEFPLSAENGDLFFSAEYGRLFVYYDESIIGIGTDEFWIDAAPFNVDLSQLDSLSLINLTVSNNTNLNNLNVTGISTLTSLNVGNVVSSGIVTASAFFGNGSGLTGVGIGSTGSINTVGIITASAFFGNGSGLTGAGSTVFNDTTTNQEFFPLFTDITTGTITASGISTSKLTYNPSSGEVTAVDFNSTSDFNLKTNIHTVDNALEIVDNLRGVSFEWKENGKKSYGVIAQELEKVLPELVKGDDPKTVSYSGIIGVLIESIKELKKEVEKLKESK
jgi:hypothetical protein